MQTKILIAIAGAIIIIGGIVILQSNRGSAPVESTPTEVATDTLKGDVKTEGAIMNNQDLAAKQVGVYTDYSPAAVSAAQQDGNKVVLFFHAPWCPYCKAADSAFKANTDKIPAKTTVLKVDYDSNRALRTKYGVTYQHTFVQINTNGDKIIVWNGGDIDSLIKNTK